MHLEQSLSSSMYNKGELSTAPTHTHTWETDRANHFLAVDCWLMLVYINSGTHKILYSTWDFPGQQCKSLKVGRLSR